MISTGNDIVSLSAIDIPRTRQLKFYSRILSASEQALYNKTDVSVIPFENYVWLLWSIKEAAYKYLKRINPDLVFSPTKFTITKLELPSGFIPSEFDLKEIEGEDFDPSTAINGVLTYNGMAVYSRSVIYKEFIASVVNNNDDFKKIWWGIKIIDDISSANQSASVRSFLLGKLGRLIPIKNIEIKKTTAGIPETFKDDEKLDIPVSFSHHGQFIAYSFLLR